MRNERREREREGKIITAHHVSLLQVARFCLGGRQEMMSMGENHWAMESGRFLLITFARQSLLTSAHSEMRNTFISPLIWRPLLEWSQEREGTEAPIQSSIILFLAHTRTCALADERRTTLLALVAFAPKPINSGRRPPSTRASE